MAILTTHCAFAVDYRHHFLTHLAVCKKFAVCLCSIWRMQEKQHQPKQKKQEKNKKKKRTKISVWCVLFCISLSLSLILFINWVWWANSSFCSLSYFGLPIISSTLFIYFVSNFVSWKAYRNPMWSRYVCICSISSAWKENKRERDRENIFRFIKSVNFIFLLLLIPTDSFRLIDFKFLN